MFQTPCIGTVPFNPYNLPKANIIIIGPILQRKKLRLKEMLEVPWLRASDFTTFVLPNLYRQAWVGGSLYWVCVFPKTSSGQEGSSQSDC